MNVTQLSCCNPKIVILVCLLITRNWMVSFKDSFTGYKANRCIYLHPEKSHRHAHSEKVPWADSAMGKRWLGERGEPVLSDEEMID